MTARVADWGELHRPNLHLNGAGGFKFVDEKADAICFKNNFASSTRYLYLRKRKVVLDKCLALWEILCRKNFVCRKGVGRRSSIWYLPSKTPEPGFRSSLPYSQLQLAWLE
jgi:hypothetical protein